MTVCSDAKFKTKKIVASGNIEELALKAARRVRVVYPEELADRLFMPFSDLAFVSYLSGALAAVSSERPDVIFSHYLEPYALAGHILSQSLEIPHVITHAGSDVGRLCSDEAVEQLFRLVSDAGIFVPKSRGGQKLSTDRSGARIRPYWPPPALFKPTDHRPGNDLSSDGPTFGFFGKFVRGKGLDKILQAFRDFRLRSGSGRFVFVGGDIGGEFSLDRMRNDLGLQDSVATQQFIPNWQIPDFISRCDAMVYIKDAYMTDYHSSIVPRELIACGAPIVCSAEALTGLSAEQLAGANLFEVDPSSVNAICSALENATSGSRPRVSSYDEEQAHRDYIESWETRLETAVK